MSNTLIVTGYDCPIYKQEQHSVVGESSSAPRLLEEFCQQFGDTIEWRGVRSPGSVLPSEAGNSQKGWADASSYKVLDQLKAASAEYRFLLVYQAPEAVFAGVYRATGGDLSKVNIALEAWAQANRSILNFFQCNRETSALVHIFAPQEQALDFSGIYSNLMGGGIARFHEGKGRGFGA
ncbi:hypothetical protein [Microbulbifer taiwanensis]|uniref:hypothetical protein n=1 Tax=Microbulbifer taiwanensis TaxID=986746 RepID=UPI003614F912